MGPNDFARNPDYKISNSLAMTKENPFKVGHTVPDEVLFAMANSPFFEPTDFNIYIVRDRSVPDQQEANRLFEAYKKYINNESSNTTNNATPGSSVIPD